MRSHSLTARTSDARSRSLAVDRGGQARYGHRRAMSKGHASQTPVMRQYLTAKAAHPDALLLFRMGDFYELFFEDAGVAAKALDLTLTARNKGSDDEVPMAGVPHHAASAYVQRLLEQGFKVAICEQMADPSKVKGIVPREVVRVVTPGIAYDDSGLDARQNHYLVAVERGAGAAAPRRAAWPPRAGAKRVGCCRSPGSRSMPSATRWCSTRPRKRISSSCGVSTAESAGRCSRNSMPRRRHPVRG